MLLAYRIFSLECFEWSFLLANICMPILGSDFLRHNHLLVDVAGSRLLNSWNLYLAVSSSSCQQQLRSLHTSQISGPEMEFKEFEPRFKSAKTRFRLSAGLNLETFDTLLSGTNHI